MSPLPVDQETINQFVIFAHGNLAGVKEMLAADPDRINTCSNLDETTLGAAAHVGNRTMADYLLSQGAELDFPAAVMLGNIEWVRDCLAAGPELALSSGAHGISVLFHAVVGGNLDMVQLLLNNGANEATITGPAATALNAAAWRGDEAMAAWLLERGANSDAPDFEGKTALQRAEENGFERIAAMIRER
jgi:uncharacterized protein